MLKSKFIRFSMSILNWLVNSSTTFASFFIVMTHNSPVNFKLIHFQLWTKVSLESPNFETFKCSGENLPNSTWHFWKHKSIFLQFLYKSWVPSNITPLYFLSSKIIYFGQKQLIKMSIFDLSSARIKICKICYGNFETTSQFFFRFFIILQCHYT